MCTVMEADAAKVAQAREQRASEMISKLEEKRRRVQAEFAERGKRINGDDAAVAAQHDLEGLISHVQLLDNVRNAMTNPFLPSTASCVVLTITDVKAASDVSASWVMYGMPRHDKSSSP